MSYFGFDLRSRIKSHDSSYDPSVTILVVMTDVLVTQRKASSMLYILPVKTNLVKRQTIPQ